MGEVTHDQVDLFLRLFEARREPRLRAAREWYVEHFHPRTPEDVQRIAPPGSQENASMRMVTSYWGMVASIVNRGLIDEEFFFETTGEHWFVWERLKPVAPAMRVAMKAPRAWEALEKLATRFEQWREARAPGSNDVMRQMLSRTSTASQLGFAAPQKP